MIAELVFVLCVSGPACITERVQMPAGECMERAAETLAKHGRDSDEPPYLRKNPRCVLLTTEEP